MASVLSLVQSISPCDLVSTTSPHKTSNTFLLVAFPVQHSYYIYFSEALKTDSYFSI